MEYLTINLKGYVYDNLNQPLHYQYRFYNALDPDNAPTWEDVCVTIYKVDGAPSVNTPSLAYFNIYSKYQFDYSHDGGETWTTNNNTYSLIGGTVWYYSNNLASMLPFTLDQDDYARAFIGYNQAGAWYSTVLDWNNVNDYIFNGDHSMIINQDEIDVGIKKCDWVMYKDGTTYYLSWESKYIETDPGINGVYPSDVSIRYQYEWKPGAGNVLMSNVYTMSYTAEPLQFNTQTIMEKSSPNKAIEILGKIIDIAQFISVDDYLGIKFQLMWPETDPDTGVTVDQYTNWCYVDFDSKTLAWYLNGNQKNKTIADCVHDYSPLVADGSTVTLKDGYFADDPDYKGPGDGTDSGYDDPVIPSDVIGTTTAYGNNNILTTSYAMTAMRLASLGAYLWGGVFESTIQKINSSPLENIISLRCYPFDLSGTDQEIYLGNAGTGVNGAKLADNYNATFTVGSATVAGYYDSFLDYEPYTSLKIFLPFCGMKDLDLNYCMGKTLSVEYVVDLGTGTGSINIYVDSVLTYTYSCNIGFDIPLSSTNSGQVAGALMSNAASTAVAVAVEAASENYLAMAGTLVTAGIKAATTKHTTSTSGNFSANVWGRMPRTCYLVYDRPTYQNIALFNHTYGRMCNQSRLIGSLSGFTMVTNLDLSGIAIMTKEEEDIIRELFRDGIYV